MEWENAFREHRKAERPMKKTICLVLLLCTTLACANISLAREHNYVTVVIDGKTSDKVHLREQPSTEAKSLGLYFTGTEVLCDPATMNSEWTWVNVGMEAGYIKSDYLYSGANPGSITPKQPTGVVNNTKGSDWVNLRYNPDSNATVARKLYNGDQVTILGETVTHWYYVKVGDLYGYMMSSYVKMGGSGSNSGNGGAAITPPSDNPTKITTTTADPKDSVQAYATIKNCTVNIVPTDGRMVELTYDAGVLRFEQSMTRGVHMLTVESISGKRTGDNAAATLYIPRALFHAVFVDVQNGEASIAGGLDSYISINGVDARFSVDFPSGNTYNYQIVGLTNSLCVLGISENATNYAINVERISGRSSLVPAIGMPAYSPNGSTYGYTNGNGSTKISVDALNSSNLEFVFVR
jgi:hypothetical protein